MSIRPRSLHAGAFLALGACFSPGAQLTDATSDASSGASASMSVSAGVTTDSSTAEPTTAPTTSIASTGGACGTCTPPTPYCAPTGECIGCGDFPAHDMSCGLVDPSTPFCDQVGAAGTGLCVECLSTTDCDAQGQKCDPDGHTCVDCVTDADCPADPKQFCDGGTCGSCDTHDDCKSGACEVDIGKCFPVDESRHWYIQKDSIGCKPGECTAVAPCCEIAQALTGIADAAGNYHIVHVAPGTYVDPLALDRSDRRVAVLGESSVVLEVTTPDNAPLILLGDALTMPTPHTDSKLYLWRLQITGSGSTGVRCLDATFLGLDEVTMTDVLGDSMVVAACTVWARRSQFRRNTGGLWLASGTAWIENSIITGVKLNPALKVDPETQLDIRYSTIANQTDLPGGLLTCVLDDVAPPAKVHIRNSAVLAGAPGSVTCAATITTETSAITDAALDAGVPAGNVTVPIDAAALAFIDWGNSDLHLIGDGGVLKDVARWQPGDPATDIDGLPRPAVPDSKDIAGADLPGP